MNGKTSQTTRVIQNTGTNYESGFQGGENVAAGPVSLLHMAATNKGAAVVYVMIFDSTAAPAGAPTYAPIAVPPGETVEISYQDVFGAGFFGVNTLAGLTWGASTSPTAYTANASDCWVSIRYVGGTTS